MSKRIWVLAVSAWVLVVIAGSGITWLAINRAGQQVSGDQAAVAATEPAVVGTIGPAPVTTHTRTPHPRSSPTSPSTETTRPVTPTTTHAPTRPHTTTQPHTTTSGPKASASSAVRTQTRTWSGTAGSMTVSCTGRTARFQGASPADGWSGERGDLSGDSVEFKFGKGGTEVQVQATCSGGTPRFQVETSGGGGGDH